MNLERIFESVLRETFEDIITHDPKEAADFIIGTLKQGYDCWNYYSGNNGMPTLIISYDGIDKIRKTTDKEWWNIENRNGMCEIAAGYKALIERLGEYKTKRPIRIEISN